MATFSEIQTTTTFIKDCVTIVATSTAAIVALLGLKAWKKQLKGKAEYELARRYSIAVYKLRGAIRVVRQGSKSPGEMITALRAIGETEKELFNSEKTTYAVYLTRWKMVKEATADIEVELLEAEALWNKEGREIANDLFDCTSELYTVVQDHINNPNNPVEKYKTLSYQGTNDEFTVKIDTAISKIERYLSKHLKT